MEKQIKYFTTYVSNSGARDDAGAVRIIAYSHDDAMDLMVSEFNYCKWECDCCECCGCAFDSIDEVSKELFDEYFIGYEWTKNYTFDLTKEKEC